jgi:hypothetical protein
MFHFFVVGVKIPRVSRFSLCVVLLVLSCLFVSTTMCYYVGVCSRVHLWETSVLGSGVGFYNYVPKSLTQPLAQAKNGDEQV